MHVSAKQLVGRGSVKDIAEYIQEREKDDLRESDERKLFNGERSFSDYKEAVAWLNLKSERGYYHFIISLDEAQFEEMGDTNEEKVETFNGLIQSGLEEWNQKVCKGKARWIAGIHLNTDNPHAHIILDREAFHENLSGRVFSNKGSLSIAEYLKRNEARHHRLKSDYISIGVVIDGSVFRLNVLNPRVFDVVEIYPQSQTATKFLKGIDARLADPQKKRWELTRTKFEKYERQLSSDLFLVVSPKPISDAERDLGSLLEFSTVKSNKVSNQFEFFERLKQRCRETLQNQADIFPTAFISNETLSKGIKQGLLTFLRDDGRPKENYYFDDVLKNEIKDRELLGRQTAADLEIELLNNRIQKFENRFSETFNRVLQLREAAFNHSDFIALPADSARRRLIASGKSTEPILSLKDLNRLQEESFFHADSTVFSKVEKLRLARSNFGFDPFLEIEELNKPQKKASNLSLEKEEEDQLQFNQDISKDYKGRVLAQDFLLKMRFQELKDLKDGFIEKARFWKFDLKIDDVEEKVSLDQLERGWRRAYKEFEKENWKFEYYDDCLQFFGRNGRRPVSIFKRGEYQAKRTSSEQNMNLRKFQLGWYGRAINEISKRLTDEESKIDLRLEQYAVIQNSLDHMLEYCKSSKPTLAKRELENLERASVKKANLEFFVMVEDEFKRFRTAVTKAETLVAWEGRDAAIDMLLDFNLFQARKALAEHQVFRKVKNFTVKDVDGVYRTSSIQKVEKSISDQSLLNKLSGVGKGEVAFLKILETKADEVERDLIKKIDLIQTFKKHRDPVASSTTPYFTTEEVKWLEAQIQNSNTSSLSNLQQKLEEVSKPSFTAKLSALLGGKRKTDKPNQDLLAFVKKGQSELDRFAETVEASKKLNRVGPHPILLPFSDEKQRNDSYPAESLEFQQILKSIEANTFEALVSRYKTPELQKRVLLTAAQITGASLTTELKTFRKLVAAVKERKSIGLSKDELVQLSIVIEAIRIQPGVLTAFDPESEEYGVLINSLKNRETFRSVLQEFQTAPKQLRALLTIHEESHLVEVLRSRIESGDSSPLTESEIRRVGVEVIPPRLDPIENEKSREMIRSSSAFEIEQMVKGKDGESQLEIFKTLIPEPRNLEVETLLVGLEARVRLHGDLAKGLMNSQISLIIDSALNAESQQRFHFENFSHPIDEFCPAQNPLGGEILGTNHQENAKPVSSQEDSAPGREFPVMETLKVSIGFSGTQDQIFTGVVIGNYQFAFPEQESNVLAVLEEQIKKFIQYPGQTIKITGDSDAFDYISGSQFMTGHDVEFRLNEQNEGVAIAEKAFKGEWNEKNNQVTLSTSSSQAENKQEFRMAWSPGQKNSLIEKPLFNFTFQKETPITIALQNTPFAAMFPDVDIRFGEFVKNFKDLDERVQESAKQKYPGESVDQLQDRLRNAVKTAIAENTTRSFHIINSTKDGTLAYIDEPDRFLVNHLSPGQAKAATMSYFPLLMTQCHKVVQQEMTVMFVEDEPYQTQTESGEKVVRKLDAEAKDLKSFGCYDCGGLASPEFLEKMGINQAGATQIRLFVHTDEINEIGYEKLIAGKGTIQKPLYKSQELPDGVDVILPISSIKSEVKPEIGIPLKVKTTFGLVQESPDPRKPNVSAANFVYFLPPSVVEDLKVSTEKRAIELQEEKIPSNYLKKIAKTTEFDPESSTFKVEGKTDKFLGLVAISDQKGILDTHPRIVSKVEETVRKKEVANALGDALSEHARRVMMVPDLTLGDKEICAAQLPEGDYVGGRYPFRGPQDVVIYKNIHKPEYLNRNVVAIHPDTAIRYSASDFDGDQLVLVPAQAIPKAVQEMRSEEYQKSLPVIEDDLTKTKKKRVDPITNAAVAELASQKMDNAVGLLTERMLSVMATGDPTTIKNYIPKIGTALQASVDAMKHDVVPDLTVLEETNGIPNLAHRKREIRENGSLVDGEVLPLENRKGVKDLGHVPRLIEVANGLTTPKTNPRSGVERFRDLFPPVSNKALNDKVQNFAKWYGLEVSLRAGKETAISHFHDKVLVEKFREEFGKENIDEVTAAYWRFLHNPSDKDGKQHPRSLGGILNVPEMAASLSRRLEEVDPTPEKLTFSQFSDVVKDWVLSRGVVGEVIEQVVEIKLENREGKGWVPVGFIEGNELGIANVDNGFVLEGSYKANIEIKESNRGIYLRATEIERETPYPNRRLEALERKSEKEILRSELDAISVREVAESIGFTRNTEGWTAIWNRGSERIAIAPSNKVGDEFRQRWFAGNRTGEGAIAFLETVEKLSKGEALEFLKSEFPEKTEETLKKIADWKLGIEITLKNGSSPVETLPGSEISELLSKTKWDKEIIEQQWKDGALRFQKVDDQIRVKFDSDQSEYLLSNEGVLEIRKTERTFPERSVDYEVLGTRPGVGDILITDSAPRAYTFLSEKPEEPRLALIAENVASISPAVLREAQEIVKPVSITINHRNFDEKPLETESFEVIKESPWRLPKSLLPSKEFAGVRADKSLDGTGPYRFPATDNLETAERFAGWIDGKINYGGVIVKEGESSDQLLFQKDGKWEEIKPENLAWNTSGRDALAKVVFENGVNEGKSDLWLKLTSGGGVKIIEVTEKFVSEPPKETKIQIDKMEPGQIQGAVSHKKRNGDESFPFINTGSVLYSFGEGEWKPLKTDSLNWFESPQGVEVALLKVQFETNSLGYTAVREKGKEPVIAPAKEHIASGRLDAEWFSNAVANRESTVLLLEPIPQPEIRKVPSQRIQFGEKEGLKVLIVVNDLNEAKFLAEKPEMVTSRGRGEILIANENLEKNLKTAVENGHTRIVWATTILPEEEKTRLQAEFQFKQDQEHRLVEAGVSTWKERFDFEKQAVERSKNSTSLETSSIDAAPFSKILESLNFRRVRAEGEKTQWERNGQHVVTIGENEALIQTGVNRGFVIEQGNGFDLVVMINGGNPANNFDRSKIAEALRESNFNLERMPLPAIPPPCLESESFTFEFLRNTGLPLNQARDEARDSRVLRFVDVNGEGPRPAFNERDLNTRKVTGVSIVTEDGVLQTNPKENSYVAIRARTTSSIKETTVVLVETPAEVLAVAANPQIIKTEGGTLEVIAVGNNQAPPDDYIKSLREKGKVQTIDVRSEEALRKNPSSEVNGYFRENLVEAARENQRWLERGRNELVNVQKIHPDAADHFRDVGLVRVDGSNTVSIVRSDIPTVAGTEKGVGWIPTGIGETPRTLVFAGTDQLALKIGADYLQNNRDAVIVTPNQAGNVPKMILEEAASRNMEIKAVVKEDQKELIGQVKELNITPSVISERNEATNSQKQDQTQTHSPSHKR